MNAELLEQRHALADAGDREVEVMMIGGGAEEITKELAASQLGL
jgi:hypothetical protein